MKSQFYTTNHQPSLLKAKLFMSKFNIAFMCWLIFSLHTSQGFSSLPPWPIGMEEISLHATLRWVDLAPS